MNIIVLSSTYKSIQLDNRTFDLFVLFVWGLLWIIDADRNIIGDKKWYKKLCSLVLIEKKKKHD